MQHCRSRMAPQLIAACSACAEQRLIPHSCGHRLCPHCQHFESERWLERQRQLRVPAEYFLITFTLPAELRPLALLHTHSRRLDLHPHVHLVMPGASLDAKSRRWRSKSGYLLNHKALAKVFRGKLLAALKAAGLTLPTKLPQKWVVDCKSVGNGDKALVYLGRYLYRGVIREADILSCDPDGNGQVSFRYRDSQSGKLQVRTLPGADFLQLLLQHVLPKGFRRARNYGFLHPNKKGLIALLHLVLRSTPPAPAPEKPRPAFLCPCCGTPMQVIRRRIAPTAARRRETCAATEMAG